MENERKHALVDSGKGAKKMKQKILKCILEAKMLNERYTHFHAGMLTLKTFMTQ